jgi:hypothetical protein
MNIFLQKSEEHAKRKTVKVKILMKIFFKLNDRNFSYHLVEDI